MAQAEQTETQKVVPAYVSYKTLTNFLASLKVGVPTRIDASLMGTLSGTARSHLMATLKYLGLISQAGVTDEKLKRLVEAEGAERQKVLAAILKSAYPFLFEESFDLAKATLKQFDEQFLNAGAQGDTVRKCAAFFTAAAKDAGIKLSPYIASVKRGARTATPRRRAQNGAERTGVKPTEEANTRQPSPASGATWEELLLSKFPQFDPAWTPEVQLQWFKAFNELRASKKEKP